MKKWIVLLRGINVSGQKKIIMSELRQYVEHAGFKDVQTFIQSGNLILSVDERTDNEAIRKSISELIIRNYGYEVGVFVIEPGWLKQVAEHNPYLKRPGINPNQLYLAILDQPPSVDNIPRLASFDTGADEYIIEDCAMYTCYANGAGKSKLTNNLIEAKLKVKATMRNWNTVLKLIELGSQE